MAATHTLMSVVGARPQFVKLAPICRAIDSVDQIEHKIVHTGQHYDDNMSAAFFDQLDISEPDVNLGIGSGSHGAQTAGMLTALEALLANNRPTVVLTYGDTNSTLAATLAASKIHIPVAHIEAGLRSFNRAMPEEINRLVADHCGDRLYAPTPQAMSNLRAENIAERAVLTGDVMLDVALHSARRAAERSDALERFDLRDQSFGLVTVHRPVNTSRDALTALMSALEAVATQHLRLLFPAHPRTRAVLEELKYEAPAELVITEPLSFLDNQRILGAARVLITDSGGMQKEAAFLGTPCLTLRGETEWTETIELGVNRLVNDAENELVSAVGEVLSAPDLFNDQTKERLALYFGTGDAALRIVSDCVEWLDA